MLETQSLSLWGMLFKVVDSLFNDRRHLQVNSQCPLYCEKNLEWKIGIPGDSVPTGNISDDYRALNMMIWLCKKESFTVQLRPSQGVTVFDGNQEGTHFLKEFL